MKRRQNVYSIENIQKARNVAIARLRRGPARWHELNNIAERYNVSTYTVSKSLRLQNVIQRVSRGVYKLKAS